MLDEFREREGNMLQKQFKKALDKKKNTNFHPLLFAIKTSTHTLEDSLTVYYKSRHKSQQLHFIVFIQMS